jgi:tetratricopeptide (TPR) repeat protein
MNKNETSFLNFENQLSKLIDDEEIINYTIEYRNYLISNNPEKALEIIKNAYLKYINHENEEYKYRLLLNYANTLIILEQFKEAIEKMLICINYYTKVNDKKIICIAIGNTASIFFRLEMYSYALYLWRTALTNFIEPNNNYLINLTINNIMMVFMKCFHKMIYSEKTLEDILFFYKNKKDISRSELYLKLFTKHNLSRYYTLIKSYDKAIEILENLIVEYEEEHIVSQQIDVYFELGTLYKKIDNEEKMVYSFKKVIQIGESINVKLLFSNIFYELYEYYKKKGNFKKALQSIESHNNYKQNELELKKRANILIKEIGIDPSNFHPKVVNIFHNPLNMDSFIFLENTTSAIIKIDIFEIIYAKKEDQVMKLYMSNSDIISVKGTFKKIFQQLINLHPNLNIFFDINSRDTFISLFWISRINIDNKKVFLRPFHNEVSFQISKRQWMNFKTLTEHKQHTL